MKKRTVRLAIVGLVVCLALLVLVPVATASMVTKILYAQENVETFKYTATANGSLYVEVSWKDHLGNASQFPVSEVDAGIAGPKGKNLYNDYDVKTLYAGTNPDNGTQTVSSGSVYYISVYPYVDDCVATVTMKLGGSGGTNISCTRMSDGATVTSPQTVNCYADDGEVYVPSAGDWISSLEFWPGTSALYWACYNDYVYERVAGTTYDTLSELYATMYYQTATVTQGPARATINAAGSSTGPRAGKWYSITPQVWPAANTPNVSDASGAEPGALAATKAPAWYTYAFPDDNVATQAPGYMFSPVTNANASKRSYSGTTSKNGTIQFKFYGSSLDWYYTTTALGVKANILIDNSPVASPIVGPTQIDQSSATTVYKVKSSWTGMSAANHTITITDSGTAGANHVVSPTSKMMTSDYFSAPYEWGGTLDPTPWAENNYDGMTSYRWAPVPQASAHAGSYSATTSTNDVVACEFTGTSVHFLYTRSSLGGIVAVYIDNVFMGNVDQSTATAGGFDYQVDTPYTGLTNTTHIIMIRATGTAGANHVVTPTSKMYTADAFLANGTYIEN